MATTKIRAKTPMKNKQKFWRKMSVKQYDGASETRTGRKLRDMMRGMDMRSSGALPIHIWLMKSAGIDTPVFDAQMAVFNSKKADTSLIEDVSIINEGSVNVA